MNIKKHYKFLVPVAIALLGLIPAWAMYLSRQHKDLSYELVSSSPILAEPYSTSDVQILLRGKLMDRPYFTAIRLTNSGNVPIRLKDFTEPISISVGKAHVVEATLKDYPPGQPSDEIVIRDDQVLLTPRLLNPSDSETNQVITTGDKPEINIAARIVGVSSVRRKENKFAVPVSIRAIIACIQLILAYGFYSIFSDSFSRRQKEKSISIVTTSGLVLSFAVYAITVVYAFDNLASILSIRYWEMLLVSIVLCIIGILLTIPLKAKKGIEQVLSADNRKSKRKNG